MLNERQRLYIDIIDIACVSMSLNVEFLRALGKLLRLSEQEMAQCAKSL